MTEGPSQDRPADKDQIKPFHAREVATGQETADVVAAVLKHAAERDVAAKKKIAAKAQPIWMLPLGLTLSVLAGFLIVAPPSWVVVNPIAAQAPEDQMQRLASQIWLYGNKIEGYRIANGRLPRTLAEANIEEQGIDYTVTGETYSLYGAIGESTLLFDSRVNSWQEWGPRYVGNLSRRIGG